MRIDNGRWSSGRKVDVVLRILRGEDLDALSRELGVTTTKLAQWRDDFLATGQHGMQVRDPDQHGNFIQDLKTKVGDQTMTIELLRRRVGQLEDDLRFQPLKIWDERGNVNLRKEIIRRRAHLHNLEYFACNDSTTQGARVVCASAHS